MAYTVRWRWTVLFSVENFGGSAAKSTREVKRNYPVRGQTRATERFRIGLRHGCNDVVANNSIDLGWAPTFRQRKMNVFVVILMSLLLVSLLVVSAAASGGQHGASELRGPSDFRMFMHAPYMVYVCQ